MNFESWRRMQQRRHRCSFRYARDKTRFVSKISGLLSIYGKVNGFHYIMQVTRFSNIKAKVVLDLRTD